MSRNNEIHIKVKTNIYPVSAILTAAYSFLDKAYVYLDLGKKNEVIVQLTGKNGSADKALASIKGEFQNELINCALREHIAKENVKIREYIVGQALYSSVQDMIDTSLPKDEIADPLGIAVPWEEKYGDTSQKKKTKKEKK